MSRGCRSNVSRSPFGGGAAVRLAGRIIAVDQSFEARIVIYQIRPE